MLIMCFLFIGPGEKSARPTEVKDHVGEEMEKAAGLLQSSPIRKPLPRSAATSTLTKGYEQFVPVVNISNSLQPFCGYLSQA